MIIVIYLEVLFILRILVKCFKKIDINSFTIATIFGNQKDHHHRLTPIMTKDADEQKRPAQVSDDNDVTKRIKKRQVKIRFIQTYHFVQFEIQHLNQM